MFTQSTDAVLTWGLSLPACRTRAGWMRWFYLQGHRVRPPPEADAVQLSVGQTPPSAPHHFSVSAALQLVSDLQHVFTHRSHRSTWPYIRFHREGQRTHPQLQNQGFKKKSSASQTCFCFCWSWPCLVLIFLNRVSTFNPSKINLNILISQLLY